MIAAATVMRRPEPGGEELPARDDQPKTATKTAAPVSTIVGPDWTLAW